jgi:photosystem II stability/assembly factor-like uncharacterized protein
VNPSFSSTVYAGNVVGVFKTTTGGTAWTESNTGFVATSIEHLVVAGSSPNILYMAVRYDAVYKSTDGGDTWIKLPEFAGCGDVNSIVIDPYNPNIVYANSYG